MSGYATFHHHGPRARRGGTVAVARGRRPRGHYVRGAALGGIGAVIQITVVLRLVGDVGGLRASPATRRGASLSLPQRRWAGYGRQVRIVRAEPAPLSCRGAPLTLQSVSTTGARGRWPGSTSQRSGRHTCRDRNSRSTPPSGRLWIIDASHPDVASRIPPALQHVHRGDGPDDPAVTGEIDDDAR